MNSNILERLIKISFVLLMLSCSISSAEAVSTINFSGGTWIIQRTSGEQIEVKKIELDVLEDGSNVLIYTKPDGTEGFVSTQEVSNIQELIQMFKTGQFVPRNKGQVKAENRRTNRFEMESHRSSQKITTSEINGIRLRCEGKWGTDYKMVNYCIDQQTTAKRKVSSRGGAIRSRCEQKWGTDYKMVEYCIDMQTAAKRKVSSRGGAIRSRCEQKWGTDYKMVEYCIDMQTTAKRNIESVYGNNNKRSRCERKWRFDYKMVEYCIEN